MSVPTFTQSPNYSSQPRKSRTWLWIVLGSTIGVLLFAALVAGSAFFALHTFFQQTNQPVPVAASYGLALMRQDYVSAFADLDSQATINGQQVWDVVKTLHQIKIEEKHMKRLFSQSIVGSVLACLLMLMALASTALPAA